VTGVNAVTQRFCLAVESWLKKRGKQITGHASMAYPTKLDMGSSRNFDEKILNFQNFNLKKEYLLNLVKFDNFCEI
jgi:hypothetical protein